jgi:hypothetical protein
LIASNDNDIKSSNDVNDNNTFYIEYVNGLYFTLLIVLGSSLTGFWSRSLSCISSFYLASKSSVKF